MSEEDSRIRSAEESARGWNIYEIAFRDDPHSAWRSLREVKPVFDAGEGVYFVSRWDYVDEILRDTRHGAGVGVSASFGATDGLAFDAMGAWLMSLDGEEQNRARGLVRRGFTPRRIEQLRPQIEAATDQLVRSVEARACEEPVDLVESLAFALPSEIIRSLFGIDPAEWRAEVEPHVKDVGGAPEDGIAMIEGLACYFEARLREDRVPSGLMADLCEPDAALGRLTRLEVVANAVLLVTAAIDTTAGLIGNSIHCVLTRPDVSSRLRADPDLVSAAIEETLRFEPSALSCSRTAGVDFEIGGISIERGSQLLLGLAAGNRDPARFADPDRFDLDRDTTGLLSFGGGRHFCLGAALARLEAQVALDRLLLRSPLDFALAEPITWQSRNPTIRAPERLLVEARERVVCEND